MLRLLYIFAFAFARFATAATDLADAATKLAGEDYRLFRWDASDATVEEQEKLCQDVMKDGVSTLVAGKKDTLLNAMQSLVLCITDNPANRAKFSETKGVYKAVVDALKGGSPASTAAAGNLVWISVFGSPENHAGFMKAGVIDALAKVLSTSTHPATLMWAAAAVQNLAASYCASEDDAPHCFWARSDEEQDGDVSITEESGDVVVDSTAARKAILGSKGLLDKLVELACKGPVEGELGNDNPYPGLNAVVASSLSDESIPPHEESENIISWAATGALKNLALDPSSKALLEPHMLCFCRLSQSYDWLENAKATDLIFFMRPSVPCWFNWETPGVEPKTVPTCIDHVFRDKNGSTCYEYEYGVEEEYCEQEDSKTGIKASSACCGCGGGDDHGIGFDRDNGTSEEL